MLSAILASVLFAVVGAKPHAGAQIGLQGSILAGADADDHQRFLGFYIGEAETRMGVYLGGYAEIEGDWLGTRLGIAYSSQGWKRESYGERWTVTMNFLQIPLELKVLLTPPGRSVRPYLLVGPYMAHLQSNHRSDYDVSDEDIWTTQAFGYSLGAGVQSQQRGGFRLGAQIRFRRDLTPNFDDDIETYNQSVGFDLLAGI